LDKLVLRKIIKTAATRCRILKLKCTKYNFGWLRPRWGSLQCSSSRPLSRIKRGRLLRGGRGQKEGKGSGEGEGEAPQSAPPPAWFQFVQASVAVLKFKTTTDAWTVRLQCVKPCSHCLTKVRLSQKSETVSLFCDSTVALFCDSLTVSLYCDSVDRA